jgi:hypothetical protein
MGNNMNNLKELETQNEKIINKIWDLEHDLRKYISLYCEYDRGLIHLRELVIIHEKFLYDFGKSFISLNDYKKD